MGKRKGRRRPTRREKIARSKERGLKDQRIKGLEIRIKGLEITRVLPPLSEEGKAIAGRVASPERIEAIRRA